MAMTCSSCGRAVESGMQFCGMCGQRQSTQRAIAAPNAVSTTLHDLREREVPVPWRRAFEILVALCDAVAHARALGADKLSLEPESFYLEPHAAGWVVTILDAELEPRPSEPHDTEVMPAPPRWLTHDRYDYWSPEKIMGKPLDGTSDVYTLGVFAFELITGRLPFADARGPAGLLTAQLKKEPPVPSTLYPKAAIPRAADAVLLACLHKQRERRYPDARMLGQAASHVLATERGVAPERVKRPAPRPVPPPITIFGGKPCGSATCITSHQFRGAPDRTLVGNWLLLDHFDSLVSTPPDYAPHPHVGMASLLYLFEGRLVHRDSLGNDQVIKPNSLSWLHAGRGVVHSVRTHPIDRARRAHLHGLELWVALPKPNENDPPAYALHPTGELPSVVISGVRVRVVLGEGFGVQSPVVTPAPLSMFDMRLPRGSAVALPSPRHHGYQRAVYVVAGAVEIHGKIIEARKLAVIEPTASVGVTAARDAPAHVVMLGSAPVVGPRYAWWYFSSSSKARLDEAKQQYSSGALGTVPGEPELTPMPTS